MLVDPADCIRPCAAATGCNLRLCIHTLPGETHWPCRLALCHECAVHVTKDEVTQSGIRSPTGIAPQAEFGPLVCYDSSAAGLPRYMRCSDSCDAEITLACAGLRQRRSCAVPGTANCQAARSSSHCRSRQRWGVVPATRLNTVVKCACDWKPTLSAISTIGAFDPDNICLARSMRR